MAIYYSKIYVPGQSYTDYETGLTYGYDVYFSNKNTDYDYSGEVGYAGCDAAYRNYIKKIFPTNPVYDEGYNPTGEYTFDINVRDPSGLFAGCMNTTIPNINRIKILSEGLESLFKGCLNIETLDLTSGDISNVRAIDHMFQGCTSLRELNIEGWNVGSMWACEECFADCPNLSSIKVTSGTNGGVEMDYSGDTRTDDMFRNSPSLPDGDSSRVGIDYANDSLPTDTSYGGYFRHNGEYKDFEIYEKFEGNWIKAQGKIKDGTGKNVTPKMLEY